jgi:hypothetical protein
MRRNSWEHTTRDEINYLKKIGSFRTGSVDLKRGKGISLFLLNLYRRSALQRKEWGDINKEIIFAFIDKRMVDLMDRIGLPLNGDK